MNTEAPLLFLPALHPATLPASPQACVPAKARHLWPGLPDSTPEFWRPADYPFTPEQAAACLADMQAMSEAALSGVPLQALAARESRPKAVRDMEEQEDLARFAETGQTDASADALQDMTLLRTAAQKALLWAWLLEERNREVRDLTRDYSAGAAHLAESLGVEHDDAALAALSSLGMNLAEDQGPLPPWRLVLENAALFLPEGSALLVNSPNMAADVRDFLTLAPLDEATASALGLATGEAASLSHAREPMWRILGRSQSRPRCPWLDKTMHLLVCEPRA